MGGMQDNFNRQCSNVGVGGSVGWKSPEIWRFVNSTDRSSPLLSAFLLSMPWQMVQLWPTEFKAFCLSKVIWLKYFPLSCRLTPLASIMGGEGGPASGKSLVRYCRKQVFLQCLTHVREPPKCCSGTPWYCDFADNQSTAVPDACQWAPQYFPYAPWYCPSAPETVILKTSSALACPWTPR